MSAKPVHPSLAAVQASTVYWNSVGAIQPYQKVYVAPGALIPSPGSNSTWMQWIVQTAMRNMYVHFCGTKATRKDTLLSLMTAYSAHETLFNGLRVAIRSPECDMEFLSSTLHSLNALRKALEQGAFGLNCLAVTYKKDKKTTDAVAALSKSVEGVFSRGLQQLYVMFKADLNTRICSIALRRLMRVVEARNDGFEWVGADQRSRQLSHFFRSGGANFVTERATVLSLLRRERINMKPLLVEGPSGGQLMPQQLASDLPRLGSLAFQGKVLYDNTQPQLYNLLGAYGALVGIFGSEKPLNRMAALLTQAGLPDLTLKAQEFGCRIKPVLAMGKTQHIAIAVRNGIVSIAHTLPFHLQDFDNIEVRVGRIQVTRQIVFPLAALHKESDEAFGKALGAVTVVDQYDEPVFERNISASKQPGTAAAGAL